MHSWLSKPVDEFRRAEPGDWVQEELKLAANGSDLGYFLLHQPPSREDALRVLSIVASLQPPKWNHIEYAVLLHRFGHIQCNELVRWAEHHFTGGPEARGRVYRVIKDPKVIDAAIRKAAPYILKALLGNPNLTDRQQEDIWLQDPSDGLRTHFLEQSDLAPSIALAFVRATAKNGNSAVRERGDVYLQGTRTESLVACLEWQLREKYLVTDWLDSILGNGAIPDELQRRYLKACINRSDTRSEALSAAGRFYKVRVELGVKRKEADKYIYHPIHDEDIVN